MGSFDFYHIYAGNICTYTFFYQSVNFYLIKKKSKTPKNKNVASVLQELFFTFSCQSFGGRGDTSVYETGFFSKRKAELLYLTYMHSMSLIALICFYSATTR